MVPAQYRYTKEHEWIDAKNDVGTVGITDFAVEKLGDIVFVELPKVGAHFAAMDSFGTVESVKAVSDLFCPVAGTVTEINTALNDKPELLNEDPHGKAWLIKVKLDDPKAVDQLLSAADYQAFLSSEEAGG